MILATYIDETSYGTLLTRHSTSCTVKIKKEHVPEWERLLKEHFCYDEDQVFGYPTDRKKPVPITMHRDALSDIVSDLSDEDYDWFTPYKEDLRYMTLEDPCAMDYVYMMNDKT